MIHLNDLSHSEAPGFCRELFRLAMLSYFFVFCASYKKVVGKGNVMCTAISFKTKDHYFGRTLDIECTYRESVTITPRNFPLTFREVGSLREHHAIIGMATVAQGYPLYYEGANECGLCMAGLNFPQNAVYFPECSEKDNVSPFEFIPWVLGQCADLSQARKLLEKINLCHIDFSRELPLSPLHWMIADRTGALVVESVAEGLQVYDNPVGVLTNSPCFAYHLTHLCDYMNLSHQPAENRFGQVELQPYSNGMGAMGLPGDLSSASRFVRAAFVKLNSVCKEDENSSISQFFHILDSVNQQRGCVRFPDGSYEITEYTSCINADKGIYYYTTYENHGISAVDMHRCDLESKALFTYPLQKTQIINRQN